MFSTSNTSDTRSTQTHTLSWYSTSRDAQDTEDEYTLRFGKTFSNVTAIGLESFEYNVDSLIPFSSAEHSTFGIIEPVFVHDNCYIVLTETTKVYKIDPKCPQNSSPYVYGDPPPGCLESQSTTPIPILLPPTMNKILSMDSGTATLKFPSGLEDNVPRHFQENMGIFVVGAHFPQSQMSSTIGDTYPSFGPHPSLTPDTVDSYTSHNQFTYNAAYLTALSSGGSTDERHVTSNSNSYVYTTPFVLSELLDYLNTKIRNAQSSPVLNNFEILDASNTTPIEITTANAHNLNRLMNQVTIKDVQGNTAANGTFWAKVTGSTTFTLYNRTTSDPVSGNGVYVENSGVVCADTKLYSTLCLALNDSGQVCAHVTPAVEHTCDSDGNQLLLVRSLGFTDTDLPPACAEEDEDDDEDASYSPCSSLSVLGLPTSLEPQQSTFRNTCFGDDRAVGGCPTFILAPQRSFEVCKDVSEEITKYVTLEHENVCETSTTCTADDVDDDDSDTLKNSWSLYKTYTDKIEACSNNLVFLQEDAADRTFEITLPSGSTLQVEIPRGIYSTSAFLSFLEYLEDYSIKASFDTTENKLTLKHIHGFEFTLHLEGHPRLASALGFEAQNLHDDTHVSKALLIAHEYVGRRSLNAYNVFHDEAERKIHFSAERPVIMELLYDSVDKFDGDLTSGPQSGSEEFLSHNVFDLDFLFVSSPAQSGDIADASNTSPITITTVVNHNLVTDDIVQISDVEGNVAANGQWKVVVLNATEFTLHKILDEADSQGSGTADALTGTFFTLSHQGVLTNTYSIVVDSNKTFNTFTVLDTPSIKSTLDSAHHSDRSLEQSANNGEIFHAFMGHNQSFELVFPTQSIATQMGFTRGFWPPQTQNAISRIGLKSLGDVSIYNSYEAPLTWALTTDTSFFILLQNANVEKTYSHVLGVGLNNSSNISNFTEDDILAKIQVSSGSSGVVLWTPSSSTKYLMMTKRQSLQTVSLKIVDIFGNPVDFGGHPHGGELSIQYVDTS